MDRVANGGGNQGYPSRRLDLREAQSALETSSCLEHTQSALRLQPSSSFSSSCASFDDAQLLHVLRGTKAIWCYAYESCTKGMRLCSSTKSGRRQGRCLTLNVDLCDRQSRK